LVVVDPFGARSKHARRRGAELLIDGDRAPHIHTSTVEQEEVPSGSRNLEDVVTPDTE
jgi:hypothetical protein